ncbi:MAG: polyprenyl synthetase family protein [Planctomycetota bacterium]
MLNCEAFSATSFRSVPFEAIVAPVRDDLRRADEGLFDGLDPGHAGFEALRGHLAGRRGKGLRSALVLLAGRLFGALSEEHVRLARVVELVHLAALLHDDVLDEAVLRRGGPTLSATRGNTVAVLFGDYLFAHACELAAAGTPVILARLTRATRAMCEGELLQVVERGNLALGEEIYDDIIGRKTAVFFEAAAELGAVLAGAGDSEAARMAVYGRNLGMAFQITDDCLDLRGEERVAGKTLATDVRHGELTLPIIHLLRTAGPGERGRFENLIRAVARDGCVVGLRSLLVERGSFAYAEGRARTFVADAVRALDGAPEGSSHACLGDLARMVVERDR